MFVVDRFDITPGWSNRTLLINNLNKHDEVSEKSKILHYQTSLPLLKIDENFAGFLKLPPISNIFSISNRTFNAKLFPCSIRLLE